MMRKFAEAYYEKYLEKIEKETLSGTEFMRAEADRDALSEEVRGLLKSVGQEAAARFDRLESLHNELESRCCKEMYLKGFMDCRKLLSCS